MLAPRRQGRKGPTHPCLFSKLGELCGFARESLFMKDMKEERMKDVVFLFPGQGSQYVGMGKGLFDSYSSVRRLFEKASDVVKKDFEQLCFEGPEADLVRTDNVQPAITLVNLACLQALRDERVSPSAAAGHSLGEYAALCAAGVFTFAETMRLVQVRGAAMQTAAERHPGGMTAVFGLDKETLTAICQEVKDAGSVEVANHNSPAQVVLTGAKEALQKAAELAKKKGAKLTVPLKVSGAWHSRFMAEAQEQMREVLAGCAVARPSFPVISNVTADAYPDDPALIREGLLAQMVSPVLWSDSVGRLLRDGHSLFVEVGAGKVLAGLTRDINRDAKVVGVQDPEGLSKLRTLLSEPI
jgi:[acyl-carrier-protein] S-malonyltransferase